MGLVVAREYTQDYNNPLTRSIADSLYCMINGECNISQLNVNNITVFNITEIINEAWVNETGDTMTGALDMDLNDILNVSILSVFNALLVYDTVRIFADINAINAFISDNVSADYYLGMGAFFTDTNITDGYINTSNDVCIAGGNCLSSAGFTNGTPISVPILNNTGVIQLPATTDADTGVIYMNGTKVLNALGQDNLFIGDSGNFFFDTLPECDAQNYFGTALTAIGKFAMDNVRCGFSNFALGESSLTNCNNCSQNVAIGADTLKQTTTGTSNVAIGQSALAQQTTTSNNIAIGRNAGFWVTSTQNTIMGSFAGDSISTGQQNTLIGYNVISGGGTHDADKNTIIGALAGNQIEGDNNILIGYAAGTDETGSDNLIIDAYDRGSEQASRDEAIIYGVMDGTHEDQELTIHAFTTIGGDGSPEDLNVTANFTGNQIFGEMFNHTDGGVTQDLVTEDVYINMTGFIPGLSNGVNFDSNNLTIIVSGTYRADYSISFSGTANNEIGFTVGINGEDTHQCHSHRSVTANNVIGNTGGTCLISLSNGDQVTLMARDENAGIADIDTVSTNLNIFRIGD